MITKVTCRNVGGTSDPRDKTLWIKVQVKLFDGVLVGFVEWTFSRRKMIDYRRRLEFHLYECISACT